MSVVDAMKEGILNGKNLDYKVVSTNTTHFLLDAANKGLVAVFPEPVLELEQSGVNIIKLFSFVANNEAK
jgi:hypothetical protein